MIVRRMGVFSVAKIMGLLHAIMGFIFGIFMSLFSLAMSSFARGMGEESAAFGALFGVGAVIFLPIFYGVLGFLGGAVMTWLYNLIAGWVGGIEIDLEEHRPVQMQAPTMPTA